jgi:crotonobetainyl-CoA:carnitine CoA-transferase CaiB-like acyl-CoA transferase
MRFVGTSAKGMTGIFALNNRGKRALAVDMKQDKGSEMVRRLMSTADVVIHNFRHGVMENFGLSYNDVKDEMPNLIYAHITGFGDVGTKRDHKGYDNMLQAITGMGVAQSDPPEVVHQLVCDKVTAHVVAQAVMAALFARTTTGVGQKVSAVQNDDATRAATIDKYYRTIKLKDGYCAVTPASDEEFAVWLDVIGLTSLLSDERFSSIGARFNNAETLIALTDKAAENVTVAQITDAINNRGLPAAIFESVEDLPQNMQVEACGVFSTRTYENGLTIREARQAPRLSHTPLIISREAPTHGQHSDEILKEIGYLKSLFPKVVS